MSLPLQPWALLQPCCWRFRHANLAAVISGGLASKTTMPCLECGRRQAGTCPSWSSHTSKPRPGSLLTKLARAPIPLDTCCSKQAIHQLASAFKTLPAIGCCNFAL